jgi:hypothetical protein
MFENRPCDLYSGRIFDEDLGVMAERALKLAATPYTTASWKERYLNLATAAAELLGAMALGGEEGEASA